MSFITVMSTLLFQTCPGVPAGLNGDACAEARASAPALRRLAAVLDAQCRHADAATLLKAALIAAPALPGLRARLALSLSAAGEHGAARAQFEAALGADAAADAHGNDDLPARPRLHLAFSRTLLALDAPQEALAQAEAAIAGDAGDACTHAAHGDALAALRRLPDALAAYQRAAMLDPSLAWAHYGIGVMFIELGRPMAALQNLSRALELSERNGKGVVAVEQGGNAAAPAGCSCLPAHAVSMSAICESIGLAFGKGGRPADALPWLERALELRPDSPAALRYMGNALAMMRADDAALACLQAARRVRTDWDEAWLDEAGVLLRRGDFAGGWRAYGRREGQRLLETLPSCWSGEEPLGGKTILLLAEQGLGDTIQFARYAPQVAELAQRVIVEVQAPLRPLFEEVARDWNVEIVARGDARPDGDYQCLLLSLPRIFRTAPDTIPLQTKYLRAPDARRAQWRERVAARCTAGHLRVGLACAGNPHFKNDALRSIPLAAFEACFDLPGIDWVIPQPEIREADRAALERHPRIVSFGAQLADFADTAALLEQLDLVISVDTSIAHLAGALARPAWILLPHYPDWRWMHDRADTPWYPTARLFRQAVAHDWPGVIEQVCGQLQARVAGEAQTHRG
ncbi:tetratricopeptide repeat protein [Trinickia mobilis]|uniref:tetratricopeptide repeat-containing glycosyltransferase family protein n=1 Tax=Trinickia mobilis TaxID=2816356 RepID=UPI001A8C4359|nr:tetratricopeptide repeat-containing glycosyltransferase family protein [Trinickia mobilis]